MRLLVLDGSRVLQSLVDRLAPDGVEVRHTESFDGALEAVRGGRLDAVIVDVTPTDLPWQEFCDACCDHNPPIPVLFESCVSETLEGLALGENSVYIDFLAKPYHIDELRKHIQQLVRSAERARRTGGSAPEDTLH
jgi:DNA-binding response OmpR family regulator